MIAATALRAAAHGPSGFSLALIRTPPTGAYGNSCAYASMGSVTMRNARTAEAAVETCKNDLREKAVRLPWCAIGHPPLDFVNDILTLFRLIRRSMAARRSRRQRQCRSDAGRRSEERRAGK